MPIQDHFLTEDLTRLHEEFLNFHNLSVTIIKNAQEGKFDEMTDDQHKIIRSIKLITALHNKKKSRDDNAALNYLYQIRR